MNKERFSEIVAAFGADARRWPAAERAAAEAFARDHADQAQGALEEAHALDEALGAAAEEVRPSDLLHARIMAHVPRAFRRSISRSDALRPALALAACALFGLVLGFSGGALAPSAAQTDDLDAIIASAFEYPALDIDSLGVDG